MNIYRLAFLSASLLPVVAAWAAQPLEEMAPPSRATIAGWAQSAFPALASSESVPENLYLGFVVNENLQVLHHSAILRPGQRPMTEDIAAMFPGVSISGSPMGGIAEVKSAVGVKPYRVIWVMVPSK